MQLNFIAGQALYDSLQAEKLLYVKPSTRVPGCFDSESLCAWQSKVAGRGIIGIEVVKSIYGWYARYDSGIQNFGIVIHDRGLTFEQACERATKWVNQNPECRYAWYR